MSSSSGAGSSDSRGAVSVEQLVGECFVKTAHIILSSRVVERLPQAQKDQSTRRKSWFKLDVEEIRSAKPSLDRWRSERNLGLPLVLEIHLQPADSPPKSSEASGEQPLGTLLERWQLYYTPLTTMPLPLGGVSRSQMARFSPIDVYKRLTLLTRSLFTYVRVLPAYRLYRATSRQRHASFHLSYRIHSSLVPGEDAANAKMHRYTFSPVETADGQFLVSVDYHPASAVRVLGHATSRIPRSPIISNYVGGGGGGRQLATNAQETATTPGTVQYYTGLETAPSAPASLDGTPRRKSWSSSFRLSPARLHESPSPGSSPLLGAAGTGFPASSGANTNDLSGNTGAGWPPLLPRSLSTPAKSGRPPLPLPTGAPAQATAASSLSAQRPASMPRTTYFPVDEEIQEGGGDDDGDDDGEHYSEKERKYSSEKEGRRTIDPEGSSPTDSAGRRLSSPMRIPTTKATQQAQRRRPGLRSSGDIKALQAAYRQFEKPLSAPTLSHMRPPVMVHAGGGVVEGVGGAETLKTEAAAHGPGSVPGLPPTPLQGAAATTIPTELSPSASGPSPTDSGASSSVAAQFPFPTSCSPDFPFAFTPRGNYSISPATSSGARGGFHSVSPSAPPLLSSPSPLPLGLQQRMRRDTSTAISASSSSTRQSAQHPPSPVQGREVAASTALMRRASWGTRSISGDGSSMANIGYSVSPLRDQTGLDSLLYSTSTPRQFMLGSSSGLGLHRTGSSSPSQGGFLGREGATPSGGGGGVRREPPLLTLPTVPWNERGIGNVAAAGDELPFAFNAEDLDSSRDLEHEGRMLDESTPGAVGLAPREVAESGITAPSPRPAPAPDNDNAVEGTEPAIVATLGAFVKLVREAKPLTGMGPVDLDSSLAQLERVTASVASHGIR